MKGKWYLAKVERRKYSDRKQYLIKAVSQRRKNIRLRAIEYKGSKCSSCGYDRCVEALEFHHTNPSLKDFSISTKGYTRSWERVMVELDKCIMLCANCHREIHAKLAALRRNSEMNSGLNQGNLRLEKSKGNPELASVRKLAEGKCRDFTPATLTSSRG